MEQSKLMAKIAYNALDDKQGEDIKVIDISQISVLADYFIIASGSNINQVQAMADNVEESLGRAGYDAKQVEGYLGASWILMDYGDIVIHIFNPEERHNYQLEKLWGDQHRIDISAYLEKPNEL